MPLPIALRTLAATIGLLFLVTLTGCGGGKASARGKVLFDGKAVKNGSVVFTGSDGVAAVAVTDAEGNYQIDGVASGTVKVGVSSGSSTAGAARDPGGRGTPGAGRPGTIAPPKAAEAKDPTAVVVPAQFGSPESSGITVQLKPGSNEKDIIFK